LVIEESSIRSSEVPSLVKRLILGASTLLAVASTLMGCSGRNPFLSYGPHPRVEDCAQIQQATPSKYICDGKQYTSVQLSDIREGKTVAAK
jgi:hypothetical protein